MRGKWNENWHFILFARSSVRFWLERNECYSPLSERLVACIWLKFDIEITLNNRIFHVHHLVLAGSHSKGLLTIYNLQTIWINELFLSNCFSFLLRNLHMHPIRFSDRGSERCIPSSIQFQIFLFIHNNKV